MARYERKRDECPQCHRPRSECSDPERDWYSVRTICFATMEREAAQAMYADLHADAPFHDGTFRNWSAKRNRITPYHFGEGVSIWVAPVDVNPEDDFLSASFPQQPADQQHEAD